MSLEKFLSDRHCISMGRAEKERESVMLHLKQEEYISDASNTELGIDV